MKLLNRSLRNYIISSVVILIAAIPVFYIVINQLITYELDKILLERKLEVLNRIHASDDINKIPTEDLDNDIEVLPYNGPVFADSIYSIDRYNSIIKETEPFRDIMFFVKFQHDRYKIIIKHSVLSSKELLFSILKVQGLIMTLMLTGLILINRSFSKKIWKPFNQILHYLQEYELDKKPIYENVESNVDEFDELNKTVKKLIERNYETYNNQKQFTENASHEIQTPLAITQSKLELLLQQPGLTRSQTELVASAMDGLERLSLLNKNLLLLTKLDNGQGLQGENININDLTNEILEIFEDQLKSKQISLNIISKDLLTIHANFSLIEILLSNLIRNAINHNINTGSITVEISKDTFRIQNSGGQLTQTPEYFFERFKKHSNSEKSVGLGLAIVKKICDGYHYKVSYGYENNSHTLEIHFANNI